MVGISRDLAYAPVVLRSSNNVKFPLAWGTVLQSINPIRCIALMRVLWWDLKLKSCAPGLRCWDMHSSQWSRFLFFLTLLTEKDLVTFWCFVNLYIIHNISNFIFMWSLCGGHSLFSVIVLSNEIQCTSNKIHCPDWECIGWLNKFLESCHSICILYGGTLCLSQVTHGQELFCGVYQNSGVKIIKIHTRKPYWQLNKWKTELHFWCWIWWLLCSGFWRLVTPLCLFLTHISVNDYREG